MNIGDKYRQHYLDIYPNARRGPAKRILVSVICVALLAGSVGIALLQQHLYH